MYTFLHLLEFDEYLCLMYSQYESSTDIWEDEQHIVAKSDLGIINQNDKMVLVIEDKNIDNAKYSNNWKEDKILGELFVAVHEADRNHKNIIYPINIFVIRVVDTKFTFYKAIAKKEYVMETTKDYLENIFIEVQSHPAVLDEPYLTAYDICNKNNRKNILKCVFYIKKFLESQ